MKNGRQMAARSDAAVMITGESGTGKEMFKAYTQRVCQENYNFVAVNCAAIPDSLLESEMFGYEEELLYRCEKAVRPGILNWP